MNASVSSRATPAVQRALARFALIGLVLLLVVVGALPVLAQETAYTDPAGQFTATIPAGWADESTAEYGLFTESGVSIYLITIQADDVQGGIDAAVAQLLPDLASGTPTPMGTVSAPNGTWTQVLYILPSGQVGIAVAASNGSATVVLLATADNLNTFQGVNSDAVAINASIHIEGVTASAAETEAEAAAPASPAVPLAEGEVTFPDPTGPYAVGRISYTWTDESREEANTPEEGDPRLVTVWIWYPTAPDADAETAPYMTDEMSALMEQLFSVGASNVRVHAYASAPVSTTESGYPVLVFSPGNGQNAVFYTALLEDIASHGYVVVGLDHSYDSRLTTLADGQATPGSGVMEDDAGYAGRIADVEFVIDQLAQVNNSDAILKGSLDFVHLGIFGHSFGGTTAAGACHADARCLGAIVIDWKLQGEVAEVGLSQPLMFMDEERVSAGQLIHEVEEVSGQSFPEDTAAAIAAQMDAITTFRENTAAMLLDKSSDVYHVVIDGTRHMSFSDVPFLAEVQPALLAAMSGIASIDGERGLRVASDYILAFFDTYLKGEPAPLLDGASADYPEVTFRRGQS